MTENKFAQPDGSGIRTELAEGTLRVTLNRPDARNALDRPDLDALADVFAAAAQDGAVRALIVTGAGRAFSAGGDVASMQEKIEQPVLWQETSDALRRVVFALLDCDKPVIARINGHAIGFGATLALLCDFTVAAEEAKIADVHVAAGLVAGDGGHVIWPLLLGPARAKQWLLTGDSLTAAEAADIGLITRSVPADQLDQTVDALASKLAAGPADAVQGTKRLVNDTLKALMHRTLDHGLALSARSNGSPAHCEAVKAFAEKRKPDFSAL